jgi:hypothetical protein
MARKVIMLILNGKEGILCAIEGAYRRREEVRFSHFALTGTDCGETGGSDDFCQHHIVLSNLEEFATVFAGCSYEEIAAAKAAAERELDSEMVGGVQ